MIATLLYLVIVLAIVGLLLWAVAQIPGIPPIVKTLIYVIVGIIILLWLLNWVGGGAGPHGFVFGGHL
jgi:hypothetical protein